MIHFRRISGSWRMILLLACALWSVGGSDASAQKHSAIRKAAHLPPAPKPDAPQNPPAEETTAPPAVTLPPADPLGRSTPYGCVIGFLKAVNSNDLGLATQYLDTTLPDEKAKELAKQLKSVLDTSLSASINSLSKEEQGNVRDDLRLTREGIGTVKTPAGDLDIFLDHVERQGKPIIWLFASKTLARIPEVYASQQKHDFSDRLPPSLKANLFGLPLWRWLAIVLSIAVALLLSSVIARVLFWIFQISLHKGKIQNEGEILRKLRIPVRILLLAVAIKIGESFSLSVLSRHYWGAAAKFFGVLGFAWLFGSIIGIAANVGTRRSIATGVQQKIAVITLAERLTKVLVAFAALLIFLKDAGINVSAMLAGLGIGGIALALAAQNALQDLFGGISIIVRDTIRVGDYCHVSDQTGTIEEIGLSSTRLRTLDRTVVSIPNSKIAQLSSENFTLRDKFWFHHLLSLRPDTSQVQIDRILSDIETLLLEDPKVEPGSLRASFIGFQDASFQIEIFAYVKAPTYPSFLKYQGQLLRSVLTAISNTGAQLAMKSQTTYLETVQETEKATQNKT